MDVGLRIDVDTLRGTELGVPHLRKALARHAICATFFFSVGPDNMGRHLWRLLHPRFLAKMLRTNAVRLYGGDIVRRGVLWPGPIIGRNQAPSIRAVAEAGHEIGLHAWDHHAWQRHIARMTRSQISQALRRGTDLLTEILGRAPTCSAAPAWRCTDDVLLEKLEFPFQFNSDCRGRGIFRPVVRGTELQQPQIPTTLPTYDEVLGRNGITNANYNSFLVKLLRSDQQHVVTIHAEVEGIACRQLFEEFLEQAQQHGARFVTLGTLLRSQPRLLPRGSIISGPVPGREGWASWQCE